METRIDDAQYRIIPAEGYLTLELVGDLSVGSAKNFERDIADILGKCNRHVVVNCRLAVGMTKNWIRHLLTLDRELKKSDKEMRFVLVPKALKDIFKEEGVALAFKTCQTLREALIDLKLQSRSQLDADFINPFLAAVIEVLKVQAKTECHPGKLQLRQDGLLLSGDVSGVIGLVSDSFKGAVVISFPEQSLLKIVSRIFEENFTQLTKEIAEGAGEIANMVLGQAKVLLNEKGYGISSAVPSVVMGHGHSVSSLSKGPIVAIPFETDVGPFYVEICLT